MGEELKCPVCGSMNYAIEHMDTTLVNTMPIVKNGQMVNDDINIHTMHCACLECDAKFDICTQNGIIWIKQVYPYIKNSETYEYDIPKSDIGKSAIVSEYNLPEENTIINSNDVFADDGNVTIGYAEGNTSSYVCSPSDPTMITKPRITIKTLQYFLKGEFVIEIEGGNYQFYDAENYIEYVPKELLDREIEILPFNSKMVKVVLL